MILIGYQGIKGSNSEAAAIELAKKQQIKNYRLIPLVSSFNVLQNIVNKTIDYGVIAMKNNTGGTVKESVQSLKFLDVSFVDEVTLPIHHFLFVKDSSMSLDRITSIVSHSQALLQCQTTLHNQFPEVPLHTDEDTATAAMKLSLELFDDTTAVLCRKNAGKDNNLHLLQQHLEDYSGNTTDFHMYTSKD